jgi:hypothetical protein
MGAEEDRNKGEVLVEIQKVQGEIASLRAKANKMGGAISRFGSWMQTEPETRIYLENHNLTLCGFDAEPVPDEVFGAMRDWQECFAIAEKLRKARARLGKLQGQNARIPV